MYFPEFQVLRLCQVELAKVTSGQIINLVAGDLQRFDHTATSIFHLMQALFEFLSSSILTVYLFGWNALSGVAFLVFLGACFGAMGKACAGIRSKISQVADGRVDILHSVISGIRVVKMYAWEWPFLGRVQEIRRYLGNNSRIILHHLLHSDGIFSTYSWT